MTIGMMYTAPVELTDDLIILFVMKCNLFPKLCCIPNSVASLWFHLRYRCLKKVSYVLQRHMAKNLGYDCYLKLRYGENETISQVVGHRTACAYSDNGDCILLLKTSLLLKYR
jgi:hypothetical protein